MKSLLSASPRDERRIHDVLQDLCVQLTGRNSTACEQQYLQSGGLVEFDVLLHGYLHERRDLFRPAEQQSITPPEGVVRQVGRQLKPVMLGSALGEDQVANF
ncbi:hypothetical protein [Deinococcus peraridilitoris]|nr:hypothetical protein [Deinococcus peraridilitoris]